MEESGLDHALARNRLHFELDLIMISSQGTSQFLATLMSLTRPWQFKLAPMDRWLSGEILDAEFNDA